MHLKNLSPAISLEFFQTFSKICAFSEIIKTNFPSQLQTNLYGIFRKSFKISCWDYKNELSNIKTENVNNLSRPGYIKNLRQILKIHIKNT
jgi:hypothetical protein